MKKPLGFISYSEFIDTVDISIDRTSIDFFRKNRDIIKIKNERIAQKNLGSIFNATLKVSNEKGFQNMSMRDLSRESGLSLGALYSYFPGKNELITMIFNYSYHTLLEIMEEHMRIDISPMEKLNRLICVHLFVSEIGRDWFYFFYMETKNLSRDNQERFISGEMKTEEIFYNLICAGVSDGTFNTENPLLTASFIKAILQDWYLKQWKFSKREIDVEQYAINVISFIESCILDGAGNQL